MINQLIEYTLSLQLSPLHQSYHLHLFNFKLRENVMSIT